MNDQSQAPKAVLLELAPLPREQVGPFLLLGLDKDADQEAIEAHWAQRIIWARKGQIPIGLPEINWARETINDPARRVRADNRSLNADLTGSVLHALAQRWGISGPGGPAWTPLDVEKPPAEDTPPIPIPDLREVRAALSIPEVPLEVPGVAAVLQQFLQEPLDPWALPLPENPLPGAVS